MTRVQGVLGWQLVVCRTLAAAAAGPLLRPLPCWVPAGLCVMTKGCGWCCMRVRGIETVVFVQQPMEP